MVRRSCGREQLNQSRKLLGPPDTLGTGVPALTSPYLKRNVPHTL